MEQHKDMSEPDLHSLKGFSTAAISTVPTKDAAGNLVWITKDELTGVVSVPPTKEFFHAVGDNTSTNGNFPIRSVSATGSAYFAFPIPHDFTSLISLEVKCSFTGTLVSADIDLLSSYGKQGEFIFQHNESDLTSTYNVDVNENYGLNAAGVFTLIEAGDMCGLQVKHNSIVYAGRYTGILLRYS